MFLQKMESMNTNTFYCMWNHENSTGKFMLCLIFWLIVIVLSWDGEKSVVDREVEKDKDRKRHWSDEYDDEIDTGKVLSFYSQYRKN